MQKGGTKWRRIKPLKLMKLLRNKRTNMQRDIYARLGTRNH